MNESPNKDGGWVPGRRKEETVIFKKSQLNFHERKGKEGFGYGRNVGTFERLRFMGGVRPISEDEGKVSRFSVE